MKQYRTLAALATILILGWTMLVYQACGQQLKQIQKGTAANQIPVTNGPQYTQVYRNAVPYILDSLHLRDTIVELSRTIDSTVVLNAYGTIITESPANTFNIKVDSTKFATNYDLTQVSVRDSTVVAAGTGIGVVESPANIFTVTNSAPDQTVSITGAGINVTTGTYPNFTITATELDGNPTNEIELPVQTGNSGKYLTTNGTAPSWATVAAGMDSLYNGNRTISRVPTVGANLGATTFREWLNWWYIANYQQPSINLNSLATPVEIGTSTVYTLSGSTSNPCTFTLSAGTVNGNSFGAATSFSYSYTHAPTTFSTTTMTASQSWSQTGTTCATGSPTTGTTSSSRSINNVHPFLFGMSATSYTSGSVPYNIWTKRVVVEASQTALTLTGTNMYIYFLVPKTWSDFTVSTIVDHNGFNVTPSFTAYDVSVTSTGLANNWTQDYKLYKLNNLTTASGFNYVYNR
jgi:hypothetical protein